MILELIKLPFVLIQLYFYIIYSIIIELLYYFVNLFRNVKKENKKEQYF